jgi:hyperosmotically inducible protein
MIRKGTIVSVALTVVLAASLVQAKSTSPNPPMTTADQIRHEIAMLPYSSIWDWIEADLQADGTVVLRGEVLTPTLKTDAAFRLRRVETVKAVVDDIRVLPASRFDNETRIAVYRALFNWNSTLLRYGMGVNPSIHIIVENGRVTLKGVVSNAMDKQLAGMAANRVSGVFSVDNELDVETRL